MTDAPPYVVDNHFLVSADRFQTPFTIYVWSDGLVTTTTDRPEGTRP